MFGGELDMDASVFDAEWAGVAGAEIGSDNILLSSSVAAELAAGIGAA